MRHKGVSCAFAADRSWVILSPIEQSIKAKIERVGVPLKDWDVNIYRGILTGCNDAFIIDEARRAKILSWCRNAQERARTETIIRPILRGRDIKRYGYDWAGLYILALFPSRRYDIDEFPAIKRHLLSFASATLIESGRGDLAKEPYLSEYCRKKLEQSGKVIRIAGKSVILRSRDGKTEEQKARKRTSNKWFEVQDTIAYWEDLSKPKIVWGEISDRTKFAIDATGHYSPEATTFFMSGKGLIFIVGFLNSSLSEYLFSKIGTTTGVGTVRWKKFKIEQLIVPHYNENLEQRIACALLSFSQKTMTAEQIRKALDEEFFKLCKISKEECEFVYSHLPV